MLNVPDIIAKELCSVQPMSSPYSKTEWPYRADLIMKYDQLAEIKEWCLITLNAENWAHTAQFFAFKTEEAYSWFKLRWL